MADDPDLSAYPHLADLLGETRDLANFSRSRKPTGSESVEREIALPEHLGGRRIRDRFSRTPKTPPAPPAEPAPARKPRLEAHLASRISEIQDTPLLGSADPLRAALERHRAQTRGIDP